MRQTIATLLFALLSLSGHAQSPVSTALADLQSELLGKRLIARDFAYAEVVRYRSVDYRLESDPPLLQAFASFTAEKVDLTASTLTITGQRSLLVKNVATQQIHPYRHMPRLRLK